MSLTRFARLGVLRVAGAALAVAGFAAPALAQAPASDRSSAGFAASAAAQAAFPDAGLEARQTELLAAMLRDPANLDIAFEYATVSARLGDYEAAIGTLERMLIYAPGRSRIQLELAVLYYRLGSFDAARSYFEATLQASDVSADVEQRARTFLAAIDTAEEPTKFSATVVSGLRWQSNANAGPGGRRLVLNGVDYLIDDTAVGRADWNVFVAGNVHAAYDLGTQGDLLEADLLFYGGRYFDSTRLNSELAELTFGPSFNLARFDVDAARFGVYGILTGVRLDDANYSGTTGLGAKIAAQPDPRSAFTGKLEYRYRWFRDSAVYSTVSNRNGYQVLAEAAHSYQLTNDWSVRVAALGDYENTAADFEQSWELGAGIGATYRFASPLEMIDAAWSLEGDAGYIRRQYDQPDPAVNPAESQRDNEFWVRGGLMVPLREDFALALSAEFRRLQSNYQTRDYSNTSVMLSVVKAF